MARPEIGFEAGADIAPAGAGFTRLLDQPQILGPIARKHPRPEHESARPWIVAGDHDARQTALASDGGILLRIAEGMPAKRGMHVLLIQKRLHRQAEPIDAAQENRRSFIRRESVSQFFEEIPLAAGVKVTVRVKVASRKILADRGCGPLGGGTGIPLSTMPAPKRKRSTNGDAFWKDATEATQGGQSFSEACLQPTETFPFKSLYAISFRCDGSLPACLPAFSR
jgi:hypothetical protein